MKAEPLTLTAHCEVGPTPFPGLRWRLGYWIMRVGAFVAGDPPVPPIRIVVR